jgi:excisionase family DNA binding protein
MRPGWLSELDWRRLNLALSRARAALKHTPGPDYDAVAIRAALQVLKEVAFSVLRHRDRQPVEALVAAADDLRDWVIADLDCVRTTIQTSLDTFEQMVRAELEHQSWWEPVETMRSELAASPAAPRVESPSPDPGHSTDDRPLYTIQEAAKRLTMSEDKFLRMGEAGEVEILSFGPKLLRVRPAEIDRLLTHNKYKYRR